MRTSSNIRLLNLLGSVDDCCSRHACNSIVVCHPHSAKGSDVVFHEEVLRQIYVTRKQNREGRREKGEIE